MIDAMVSSALLLAVPLVLAATGGLVHRLSGVVNIGLEGQMLIGAIAGAAISGLASSWLLGVLAGFVAGAAGGLLMSVVITRGNANMIIVGLGFVIATTGAIGYVLRGMLGVSGTLRVDGLEMLPRLRIPGVDAVPVLGAVVSGKDPLFWFALLLLPLVAWALRATPWGLRVRATGSSTDASRSLGLATKRIQDGAGTLAGALAGLAGAHLSLGQVGLFNEQMTSGRGYIALAAFYFGRNRPWPTAAACLLFAFFEALQTRLQTQGIAADLVQTLPYAVVVVVLAATAIANHKKTERQAVT